MYYVSGESSLETSQLPSRKYEIMGKFGAEMALNLPPWLPNYDVKWLNMNFTCVKVELAGKSQSCHIFVGSSWNEDVGENAMQGGKVWGQF